MSNKCTKSNRPINIMAVELRLSGKYSKRVIKSKKVYNRKRSHTKGATF